MLRHFSFLLTICFLSVNFKSLIHFSFVLLVFSYIFRSLYMCMTGTICYTDCIILCSPFFYGFRGIFVNYLIWKQTQFISDPAFNLFCTFIREKSLKHISGHDPFFMSFEPFLLALMVKPDLLASGCRVPQRTLLCSFVPCHSWTVVVWAYFWPSYVLPPHCCRWVPPVRPTLYPDQRLSLGISVSGKISLNPPGSCQWTKDHLMHTYSIIPTFHQCVDYVYCLLLLLSHSPASRLRITTAFYSFPGAQCLHTAWWVQVLNAQMFVPQAFGALMLLYCKVTPHRFWEVKKWVLIFQHPGSTKDLRVTPGMLFLLGFLRARPKKSPHRTPMSLKG